MFQYGRASFHSDLAAVRSAATLKSKLKIDVLQGSESCFIHTLFVEVRIVIRAFTRGVGPQSELVSEEVQSWPSSKLDIWIPNNDIANPNSLRLTARNEVISEWNRDRQNRQIFPCETTFNTKDNCLTITGFHMCRFSGKRFCLCKQPLCPYVMI